MALIIKGDMPSCCAVCCDCNSANDGNFCNRTGNRLGNDWQLYRPLNCPIIGEIPDEHGRLVDADANREDFMDTVYSELYSDGDNYRANRIIDAYDNTPTVLEANND